MPDLLTHVLLAYVLFALATWRFDRLPHEYVSLGMVGATLPDLSKLGWLFQVPPEEVLPVSFAWAAFHRLGPLLVLAGIGALLFERRERLAVFGVVTVGGLTHFFLDALNARADGLVPPYFYPFTWWRPPTGDLWVSSEIWPSMVALLLAAGVWYVTNRR